MMRYAPRSAFMRWTAVACAVALVLATGLWWASAASGTRVTALFDKAVGVYPGSSVRVLGVEVGTIDAVRPQGRTVRVDLTVDEDTGIPAGANAVIVAPSLVSDRYVQLTPAYSGGPRMTSGTVIGTEHTAEPADIDELYRSVNELSRTLGPNGANSQGALSRLVDTGAANLRGNGEQLNATMRRLGELAGTLSDNKGDLFATVDRLNEFTATLAKSDSQVRDFYQRSSDVAGFLGQEREQVGGSLNALAGSLTEVKGFIQDNKDLVGSNVQKLTGVTKALADQRAALAEVLDVGPTGATNFTNAYDAASGTTAVRPQLNELTYPPALMVCKLLEHGAPMPIPKHIRDTCTRFAPVLDGATKLPSVGQTLHSLQTGEPLPMPLPVADLMAGPFNGAPPEPGARPPAGPMGSQQRGESR